MLTFEEKEAIIKEFPELIRKEVSMKRVNYHYEESKERKERCLKDDKVQRRIQKRSDQVIR